MVVRAVLGGLCCCHLAWAEPTSTAPPGNPTELDWIEARNALMPNEPYPAGLGLAPEMVDPPSPDPAWTFWAPAWSRASLDWTRGLYVAFRLADDRREAALRNELPHLTRVLARFNFLAAHAGANPTLLRQCLRKIIADGMREAARAANGSNKSTNPRHREILTALADAVRDDAKLRVATAEVERLWRKHDVIARGRRELQAIAGGALVGSAFHFAAPWIGDPSDAWSVAAFLSATVAGITLGEKHLPFTARFTWRENLVRDPVARCEDLMMNERVVGQ